VLASRSVDVRFMGPRTFYCDWLFTLLAGTGSSIETAKYLTDVKAVATHPYSRPVNGSFMNFRSVIHSAGRGREWDLVLCTPKRTKICWTLRRWWEYGVSRWKGKMERGIDRKKNKHRVPEPLKWCFVSGDLVQHAWEPHIDEANDGFSIVLNYSRSSNVIDAQFTGLSFTAIDSHFVAN